MSLLTSSLLTTTPVKQIESNDIGCATLAEQTGELVEAMIKYTEGKSEADMDPRFLRDMKQFQGWVSLMDL
jgi:hypothetical protein